MFIKYSLLQTYRVPTAIVFYLITIFSVFCSNTFLPYSYFIICAGLVKSYLPSLTCAHIYASGRGGKLVPTFCCSMSQSPSRKGLVACGGKKVQYFPLMALKQKFLASAVLTVQEIDCFSVPVATDKCRDRNSPHSDSNSEECFKAPGLHRYMQRFKAHL